jgi:heat shock protein HslJ
MKKLIFLLPVLMLLGSCSSSKTAQTNEQATEVGPTAILNDIWALVSIDAKELDFSDTNIYRPVLEIKLNDSIVIGNTGCNNFQAKMILDGNKISFPPFPMTRRYCPGYENVFVEGISNTASYKIKGLQLFFYDKEGNEVLGFKKVD